MSDEPISADEFKRRLAKLCLTSGGYGLPQRTRDRRIVLKAATLGLDPCATYTEREMNGILIAWLRDAGPSVETDHVALRRALVDERFIERGAAGEWYRLGPEACSSDRFAPEVDAIAPDRVIREAQAEREARRRRHDGS